MPSTLEIDDSGFVPILEISTPESVIIEIGIPGPKGTAGSIGVDGDAGADGIPGIILVTHGADPNVVRPAYPIVYWIGAATPVNALNTDFWKNS